MEAPLKSHLDARLLVQGRALWLLRTSPGTHIHGHSRPPAHPCVPPAANRTLCLGFWSQACTELTVIIGRWAAGFWVSIQQGLMEKKKTKLDVLP